MAYGKTDPKIFYSGNNMSYETERKLMVHKNLFLIDLTQATSGNELEENRELAYDLAAHVCGAIHYFKNGFRELGRDKQTKELTAINLGTRTLLVKNSHIGLEQIDALAEQIDARIKILAKPYLSDRNSEAKKYVKKKDTEKKRNDVRVLRLFNH